MKRKGLEIMSDLCHILSQYCYTNATIRQETEGL